MKKSTLIANLPVLLYVALLGAAAAHCQALTPAWVELGASAPAIVRIVVTDPQQCPSIRVDGSDRAMSLREPIPPGLRPVCESAIPKRAKSVSVNGQPLALPAANPSRVVVIGDTGCRVKGRRAQACNDPTQWPFEEVAGQAAAEKAQLVIHVGDYLYRESPCPSGAESLCGGTPIGDNWAAWNADFFQPASKLLSAAPWAFSRGNHEDCGRSWRGWFYYLDPRPWNGVCQEYSNPYVVHARKVALLMFDSSAINEDVAEERQVAIYAAQLKSMRLRNAWLVSHYPFWGFKTDSSGGTPPMLSVALQAAWNISPPKGVDVIMSGHVHLFEFVSMDHRRPTQLLAGDGGTQLAVPIKSAVDGMTINGATVMSAKSRRQFGYILLTKAGKKWSLQLKNRQQQVLVHCSLPGVAADCTSSGSE